MAGRKAALALRVPKNTEELLAHAPCPEVLSTVILQWHVTTGDSIHGNKGDLVKVCWFQSENEEKHWLTQTQVLRIYSCQIQGQHDFECWCQIFGVQRQRTNMCTHTVGTLEISNFGPCEMHWKWRHETRRHHLGKHTLKTLKEIKMDCNGKQNPIFGLESICCNSVVCKFAGAATGSTISCCCILL